MTFEKCHDTLTTIRRTQGTRCPLIRIDYSGQVVRGRLARSDSDPDRRHEPSSPYGILVLEPIGLNRGPETILQIANIPDDGLERWPQRRLRDKDARYFLRRGRPNSGPSRRLELTQFQPATRPRSPSGPGSGPAPTRTSVPGPTCGTGRRPGEIGRAISPRRRIADAEVTTPTFFPSTSTGVPGRGTTDSRKRRPCARLLT